MTDGEHEPTKSESGWMPEASEWDWMEEEYPIGINLMFVRGVTPERVIEAFGADPAAARLLSAEVALETLSSWIRVGHTGEWAFTFHNWFEVGVGEFERRIARELSAGTDLVLFNMGPNMDYFYYFADGAEVTSFEPLLSEWRHGSDPDRFVPQMRQVGLDIDPPPEDDETELQHSPTIALLEMLTLALGIRLSRDVAFGPLLTVQPGPAA